MQRRLLTAGLLAMLAIAPGSGRSEPEFRSIFDGKSLAGWSAPDSRFWSVEDGAITARSTVEKPCKTNQFLVWQGGEPADFELKLEFRIQGPPEANSGIQFRTKILPDGHAQGYQADIDRAGQYLGALYDEHTGRDMLAARGQRTAITREGERRTVAVDDAARLLREIDPGAWNEYHISARGHVLTLSINGRRTAEVYDHQVGAFDPAGKLALQLHSGPPTTVQFRNIRLRVLKD